jgi:serralysin
MCNIPALRGDGMKPVASLDTIIAQLTGGPTAGPPWDDHDLTFSFPSVLSSDYDARPDKGTFLPLNDEQKAAARAALAAFQDVADVRFTEVSGNDGDLRFHNFASLPEANAVGFHPGAGMGGDVLFSPTNHEYHDLLNPRIGAGHGFLTYMHEVAHAMGMGHAGNYNGGSPSYEADALFAQDTEQYTVMSYFRAYDAGADIFDADGNQRFAQTLMLYDIAAIQHLYGANMSTRTGNTVYGFNSTAGGYYDFATNDYPVVCIWDAGGIDTLDFSGYRKATRTDLREGAYSDTPLLTGNVSIAFGTVIENAVGGSARDTIIGNGVANVLKGRGGSDRLDGGLGRDTLNGGDGRDKFLFSADPGEANADRIDGFRAADDVIYLERALFTGIAKTDGIALKAGQFHASKSGKAHDKSDRILYDTTDGKLYWDSDGSRSGHDRELFATLKGHPDIDAADFLIV